MRVVEPKCYSCADCGMYLLQEVLPGRVPEEVPLWKYTHPDGTCASAKQHFTMPQHPWITDVNPGSFNVFDPTSAVLKIR